MEDKKEFIARTVAKYFKSGDVVNLGIGLPTLVGNYIGEGVFLHTENGLIGYGPSPEAGREDEDFIGAGAQYLTLRPGASIFDSAMSFAVVRGGHLTATVLGALEVDAEGNLANWALPGRMVGMGGAMDLVNGTKNVIVVTEHVSKNGTSKILKKCQLPLTGKGVVTMIVTDLCVLEVGSKGLIVKAMAEGVTREALIANTEAELTFAENVEPM